MAEQLKVLNLPVSLVRTTDETLSLGVRTNRINSLYGGPHPDVIVISNHLNAAYNINASGAEVIYALRNTPELANNILDGIVATGIGKRSVFRRASAANSNLDHFAVIRDTSPSQSLIVEYGFISNLGDANFIRNNWQSLVDGAIDGIKTYLANNYNVEFQTVNEHVVASGDTLFSIARMYDTSVDELMRLNNLSSTLLQVGQKLIISNSLNRFNYTVLAGDTLWSIAQRFDITLNDIIAVNNLSSSVLTIGQELIIPISVRKYIIEGDSLESIASKFNTSVDAIRSLNNFNNQRLCIGQEILIPNKASK